MSENTIERIVPELPIWVDRRLVSFNFCNWAQKEFIPSSLEEHRSRCDFVKRRLLLSAGLVPELKIPQNAPQISAGKLYHGVIIKDVSIETMPGLRLTGSLFLPEKAQFPVPGILSPHGHWQNGRVHHAENGGVVMRCFELARLGFAVFAYDMIGYNENNDLPHSWQIDFKRRADVAGVSTFGLQTANSMRALDFLCSLDEVDERRIGCTGASGGASQTWFIAALDERIKVAAPVCMLSSHFQGGCPCEEGPLLRTTGLTSFDIVSALAPRPVMLPGVTGDWTNLNPEYEIPALEAVYKLYNAEKNVHSFYCEDVHNYNRRTREHIYAFLMRELMGVDRGNIIPEEDIAPPPPELLWHSGTKPEPATESSAENALSKISSFLADGIFDIGNDFENFKKRKRELLRMMLETGTPPACSVVERVLYQKCEIDGAILQGRTFSRRSVGDFVTSLELKPPQSDGKNSMTVVISDTSWKEFLPEGERFDVTQKFIESHQPALIVEPLGTGSSAWQLKHAIRNTPAHSAAFDQPFFSMRVQDVITVCTRLQEKGVEDITLVSSASSAPVALAAAALMQLPIICDLDGVDDSTWLSELNFQPLIGRLGGIAALLMLNSDPRNVFSNVPQKFAEFLR